MAKENNPTINESDFDAAILNQRRTKDKEVTEKGDRSATPNYRMNLEAIIYAENSGE